MQIDWSQAPEWANYVAMDDDGMWYWYERKPKFCDGAWITSGKLTSYEHLDVRDSLQQRPEADK